MVASTSLKYLLSTASFQAQPYSVSSLQRPPTVMLPSEHAHSPFLNALLAPLEDATGSQWMSVQLCIIDCACRIQVIVQERTSTRPVLAQNRVARIPPPRKLHPLGLGIRPRHVSRESSRLGRPVSLLAQIFGIQTGGIGVEKPVHPGAILLLRVEGAVVEAHDAFRRDVAVVVQICICARRRRLLAHFRPRARRQQVAVEILVTEILVVVDELLHLVFLHMRKQAIVQELTRFLGRVSSLGTATEIGDVSLVVLEAPELSTCISRLRFQIPMPQRP